MRINANAVELEFQRLTEDSVQALRDRMAGYLQSVKGTAAFIGASDVVSHEDFEAYTDALEIAEQLPGLSGLGHIVEVRNAKLDDFVDNIRAQGRPDFSVKRRSAAETHFVIRLIEPKVTNLQALGLDVTFAAERANVLKRARETRLPQMTPPIQLVQENRTLPGFALFMPIFSKDPRDGELSVFKGWVNAAFVAQNLIKKMTLSQDILYRVQVSDGLLDEIGVSIYDGRGDAADGGKQSATYQLDQFGRNWTLIYTSTPRFDAAYKSYQPLTALAAGLALTGFLVLILRNINERAESLRRIAQMRMRQIKEHEGENRALIENTVTSVLVIDALGRIRVANQAAQQCFGYTEPEIVGLQFASLASEIVEPDGSHNAIGWVKGGRTLELDLQRNDWLTRDRELRTTAIIRDLTEQNNAQRELRRHKILNDLALQGAEIGVFDIDLRTGKSEVSETWCRIMGYESGCNDMHTQRNFLERVHPDDLAILQVADTDCSEGRTQRSIAEYRLKTREGGWCWMRSDAVIVERDEHGKALRMVGTQTDITKLRRDRIALETNERQFRQILDSAPIGMALMDDEGNFINVNAAFCQLTGRNEDDLVQNGKLAELMPSEDRKLIYATVTKMMSEGETTVYTGEHQILHHQGEERWGLLNVSWSFDKNKGSNFFIAQIIDVTAQRKLDMLKDEFVSTVSHELRTPLTSIKGALGMLSHSKDSNLTISQERLIEIAGSNADRLTDIVNDILDLQGISSGQIALSLDELKLADVIETTVREMAPFALTHDNTLCVDLPDKTVSIFGDFGRTKQVLVNLISNACKFSNKNSEVLVKAERLGTMAIIYVQNTGPGVPEKFAPLVFKAFSQADSSDTREKGGTGLGLNISRQIVLRHGGQIGYESRPDGITVFWFTMPLFNSALEDRFPDQPLDKARA